MVLIVQVEGKTYYACGACGLIYKSLGAAEECERWCTSGKGCSVQITRKSIGLIRRRGLRLH